MKQLFACVAAATAVAAALGLSPASGAAGSRPRSGPHTTVHVSGRWTVVVRSRSGRVRRRVRFENALVGMSILPSLLTGTAVIGNWEILAAESTAGGSLAPASGPADLKQWSLQTSEVVPALQVTAQLPVTADGTIGKLSTAVQLCGPDQSPADCRASTADYVPFTSKAVSVPVKAGDTVTFTVLLSFDPGNDISRFGTFPQTLVRLLLGSIVPRPWSVGLAGGTHHLWGPTTAQVTGGSVALTESVLFNPSPADSGTPFPTFTFDSGSAGFFYCSGTMAVTACQTATPSGGTIIDFQIGTIYLKPGQQVTATYTLGFS